MVELFSAAHANWPQRNSKAAAKMIVKFDRVPLDVIPDLLIFLSPRAEGEQAMPAGRACATRDIQTVSFSLTIRGVYANSDLWDSRFLSGRLREVKRDW
jgi:hypothetical protein